MDLPFKYTSPLYVLCITLPIISVFVKFIEENNQFFLMSSVMIGNLLSRMELLLVTH